MDAMQTIPRLFLDFMQMRDPGTHMTKQAWARTCKRVQSRLDNLKIDALMPATSRRVP